MSEGDRRGWIAFILVGTFVLNAAFSSDVVIRGFRPNLAICGLLITSLYTGANVGAGIGFAVGLMEASFAGDLVGSFIVSRTLAGFVVGALEERIYRDNIFVALAVVMQGTLFVHACFFLFAPQPHALQYATRAAGECLYNGALSIPLFYIARRLRVRKARYVNA